MSGVLVLSEHFHKHRLGLSKEEQSYHQRTDFVLYCHSCDKRTSDKEAVGDHSRCPYASLSKAHMQCVLDGGAISNREEVIRIRRKEEKKIASLEDGLRAFSMLPVP